MNENKKKEKIDNLINVSIAIQQQEKINRYGDAIKEHLVAYGGVDNGKNGIKLKKSLKSISKSKINQEYKKSNYKQQAGFSAEVKEVANKNAENIIKGTNKRKIRADDIGKVNDSLFDHFELDGKGNILSKSASQMKFVGNNSKDSLNRLMSNKFSKYIENDVKIEVPSDYYDGIMNEADSAIKKLNNQLKNQLNKGNIEQANQLRKKIDKYKKIQKNLKKSSVSNKEAIFARKHPKLSTAKSVTKLSVDAGIETAKSSAMIGGSVSLVRNIVSYAKGEEDKDTALINVTKDTTFSLASGYGTGHVGATVKGLMQNSKNQSVRNLSKTNLPAVMVQVAITSYKTLSKYFSGEINDKECLENLGEEGTGMISSALYSTIGQMIIPIPVVGSVIGGMVGYAISSASYCLLMDSLKKYQLSKEQREAIENECAEQIKLLKEYRFELNNLINDYVSSKTLVFEQSFNIIKSSFELDDIDGFICGTNKVVDTLGGEIQFSSFDEFDTLMNSSKKIKL